MSKQTPLVLLTASALVLAVGCATAPPSPRGPAVAAPEPTIPAPVASALVPTNAPLELAQAFAMVLVENPTLTAFSYDVRAAEARLLQARARPNPRLGIGLKEFNRDSTGLDSSEFEIALEQQFELGGKRRWRTRMAAAQGELAGWDYAARRLDLLADTTTRFVAVAVAQRRVELVAHAVALAEDTHRAVGERVKAGKEPALQAAKSASELELVRMAALDAADTLRVARQRLATLWGAPAPTYPSVTGQLDLAVDAPPPLERLRSNLPQNPHLARGEAELRLRGAAVASAKAARLPDLTAGLALSRYQEDDTDALSFGVGIPLPLFDRNRGNIEAAKQERSRATATQAATRLMLQSELATTHTAWSAAHRRVKTLREKVIPNLEAAFEGAQEGYRQGKFSFLDMLDSQRLLFEARGTLLAALSDYHTHRAEARRLAPRPLDLNAHAEEEKH
jgi:cobalt-zinc-cadmium efflux system outer membrane protein